MMKSLKLGTIVLLFLTNAMFASSGVGSPRSYITGSVVDEETNEPLIGVNVVLEGTSRGDATGNDGRFEINNISPGIYKLISAMIGYETLVKEVDVIVGETISIDFTLKQSPLELRSIVFTGTRTPRYVKDIPIRTEVITSRAIEQKSASNLYEALAGTPGIRVEQQCQFCNFSALRMQGLGADHTQILLDGQPLYSGLASVYGLQQISTADISQIEVVKGAGSALYGSNAVAGAINIVTKKPARTRATAGIELGEYNTNKYEVTAATRKGNVGIFLFSQQNKAGEIDYTRAGKGEDDVKHPDGVSDRVRTNATNIGFNLYIDDVTRMDGLTVRGRVLNEHRQGGILTDGYYENPFTDGTERIITDRFSGGIGYHKSFMRAGEIHFDVSYTNHKRNATNDTFLGDYMATHEDSLPSVLDMRPYIAEEDLYVATFSYVHRLGADHRLLAGVQYSHNMLNESGKYVVVDDADPLYGESYTSYSEKEADDFGVFVQDEYTITRDLELAGGVRFDTHRSRDEFRGSGNVNPVGLEAVEYDESAVNPRFAIKYSATEALTLRGSFGTGFRVPYGFSEELHLCSGSPRVWKPANLKPEKSMSYGVAADYSTSNLGLSLNLYRTDLQNKIDFAEASNQPGYDYQWENIDDAFVMGAEIGAQYAITGDLVIAADFAFNVGEYKNERNDWAGTPYYADSKKISRYPSTAGGAKIEFSPRDWLFVFNGGYTGIMYIDYFMNNEDPTLIHATDPYVILNCQISRTLFDNYKVYAGAHNLGDCVQNLKYDDDAAFMFAPVYGRIIYGGVEVTLQ